MIKSNKYSITSRSVFVLTFITILLLTVHTGVFAAEVFSPEDVLKTKRCSSAVISPGGEWIAYTVSIQRDPGDKPGGAYSNLFLISAKTGEIKPFITGKENVSSIRWSPDGREVSFLISRGEKEKTQIWAIRADGGEAYQLTKSKSRVLYFQWHPSGKKIAYIAVAPSTKKEKNLADKGYKFIFFEENLKHRNLYMVEKKEDGCFSEPEQLTKGITIWDFKFSPDGKIIAAAASEKNLVDYRYMFRKINLLDLKSRKLILLTDNPGKLGNYAFSPDGFKLVYTAAKMRKDHAVSQVYVINTSGGEPKNLTPPSFRGHVSWAGWKDNKTILYKSGEGVWPTLSLVNCEGGIRKVILNAKESGIIFSNPEFTKDFKHFAFTSSSPRIPADIFYWQPGGKFQRLTNINPWEELYVHSGKKLEERWEFSLKRSPIYYAHQSKTAVLIAGGAADPRVHPSQSLEFYRRLKMNGHPAVRLVRYPGEGHGNQKQPGRIDVLYRHLQWYDWYVKDKKPLDGPMPPLDISDLYGLDLED